MAALMVPAQFVNFQPEHPDSRFQGGKVTRENLKMQQKSQRKTGEVRFVSLNCMTKIA
jgi:hypothetical protein